MTDLCRECYYWIERPAGDDGCRLLIDRPEIGVCVARLTARVRELEEREAKPDLTPGLERAREVLRELARGWADATADHLMDALREDAGPERETAARLTEECAIRRSALLSAADGIGEEIEGKEETK